MKKYRFAKCLINVSTTVCLLFFAGCGKDDDGGLPNVPSVGVEDGKLGPHEEKDNFLWKNKSVTKDNLEEFAKEFDEAMHGRFLYSPQDIVNRVAGSGKDTVYGVYSGYFIEEWWKEETDGRVRETTSRKFFDFSNNGRVFLGGAAGDAFYDGGDGFKEIKINGEIKFNGLFKGSVAYKNFYIKRRNNNAVIESNGNIAVKSGGEETDFRKYWYLHRKYWYLY